MGLSRHVDMWMAPGPSASSYRPRDHYNNDHASRGRGSSSSLQQIINYVLIRPQASSSIAAWHYYLPRRGEQGGVVWFTPPLSWSDTEGGDIFRTDTEGGEREQYSGIGWWAREPKDQWMYHYHHPMPQTLVPLGHVYYGNWISIGWWGIISRCER